MEVLHKGVDPRKVPFILECTNCKTIVRLVESELKSEKNPGSSDSQYVDCPCCTDKIYYSEANEAVAEKRLKEKKAKEQESSYVDMRDLSYGNTREWSGGASGPQPPPELPKYITVTKNLSNLK